MNITFRIMTSSMSLSPRDKTFSWKTNNLQIHLVTNSSSVLQQTSPSKETRTLPLPVAEPGRKRRKRKERKRRQKERKAAILASSPNPNSKGEHDRCVLVCVCVEQPRSPRKKKRNSGSGLSISEKNYTSHTQPLLPQPLAYCLMRVAPEVELTRS